MKVYSLLSVFGAALLLFASCDDHGKEVSPSPVRKVQFSLYTDKDFSNDNGLVTFKASIQNDKNQTLWDSTFAPMKLKDIPKAAQKIVVEKAVPGNVSSPLKVGFYYSIENIGNSWYVDRFEAGETLKKIDFNFQ